jgi:hypothetical protein
MLWIVLSNKVYVILDFINFNCDRKLHERRKNLKQNEYIVPYLGHHLYIILGIHKQNLYMQEGLKKFCP